MPNAGNLWDELRKFQEMVSAIQQRAPNPRDKEALGELLEHVKKNQAQVENDLPKLLDHLSEQAKTFKAKAESAQQELAKSIQQAEALHQQAAQREQLAKLPAAKPVVAAIDPHLGKKLQAELLGKFDQHAGKKPAAAGVEQREAWQDWSGFESQRGDARPGQLQPPAAKSPAPAAAPPAPPPAQHPEPIAPPPAQPAAQDSGKLDDDVWQGLSRSDQSTPPSGGRRAKDTKHPGSIPPARAEEEPPPPPKPHEHQPPSPPARPKSKPKKSEKDDDDDIWKGLSSLEG
ncbi:MAG: hypothetical protein AB7K24_07905 [Gemmataceae bacterium]